MPRLRRAAAITADRSILARLQPHKELICSDTEKDVRSGGVPAESGIKTHRIAGQKPVHNRCDQYAGRAQKQMHAVGHKGPRMTGCNRLLQQTRELLDKVLTTLVFFKYRLAFEPSNDDMMQVTGSIFANQIEMRYLQ